ncbi:MAG: putative rane protein, partial [Herbinix sp.]|nr:putative rane protein [Herbinix sp.]
LFGFIAENKTLFGVLSYLERLLGILPLVLIVALCLEKSVNKYLLLAFTAPLVFAFTISLTIDVTVNHKYIMMSCILLGIFAAAVSMKLLERKELVAGIVGVVLVFLLTATGIYDFITIMKKNTPNSAIVLDLKNELTAWIDENSRSEDIFLSSNYSINQVVLGGAMLYEGWPYYPWSAGYDTNYRTEQVKLMYEAATPSELTTLVKKENIRFIIVDYDNRSSEDYIMNEENISQTYECVYSENVGDWKTSIYDTQKPLQ